VIESKTCKPPSTSTVPTGACSSDDVLFSG
jgi:hypothetical protein